MNLKKSTTSTYSFAYYSLIFPWQTSAAESAESCSLIREGAPCEPVPSASSVWDPDPHQFFEEGARIEAGFRKYFHRADPTQKENSVQILVCHGNVIRYFVCRALQLPPQVHKLVKIHNYPINFTYLFFCKISCT